jgi:hypothetical protein
MVLRIDATMQINLPFCISADDRLKIVSNKQFGLTLLTKDPLHSDRRTFYISEIHWVSNDTIVIAKYGSGLVSYNNEPATRTEFFGSEIFFVNQ